MLLKCIEGLNVATIRYAKSQVKWLKKRISTVFSENGAKALLYEICLNDKKEYELKAKN